MIDVYYVENYNDMKSEVLITYFLKKYYGIKQDIEYKHGKYGKPYLKNDDIGLFFSVSHCNNTWVCCFSDSEIGLDIENIKRIPTAQLVSKFHLIEKNYVLSDNREYLDRFWEIWTKKEAYLKFLGVGFHNSLDSFNVFELKTYSVFYIKDFVISIFYRTEDQKIEIKKFHEINI